MASQVEIINLALSHIGVGKEISSLETERSEEAAAGRRFYDICRDVVLEAAEWPFTRKIATIALVQAEPNTEWAYSYRYPTDCLHIRRVLSGLRNDTRQSRAPYLLAQDSSGTLIYTDEDDAQMEYTAKSDNPQFYPSDFVMAFSLYLAVYIAPRLTAGDQFKLGQRAMKLYEYEIGKAKARAYNEEQEETEPDSELMRERG